MTSVASLTLSVLNPAGLSWELWAGSVVSDLLGQYNLPNPGEEGLWHAWATELLNVTALAGLGIVDPRTFGADWRSWAAVFIMTVT